MSRCPQLLRAGPSAVLAPGALQGEGRSHLCVQMRRPRPGRPSLAKASLHVTQDTLGRTLSHKAPRADSGGEGWRRVLPSPRRGGVFSQAGGEGALATGPARGQGRSPPRTISRGLHPLTTGESGRRQGAQSACGQRAQAALAPLASPAGLSATSPGEAQAGRGGLDLGASHPQRGRGGPGRPGTSLCSATPTRALSWALSLCVTCALTSFCTSFLHVDTAIPLVPRGQRGGPGPLQQEALREEICHSAAPPGPGLGSRGGRWPGARADSRTGRESPCSE